MSLALTGLISHDTHDMFDLDLMVASFFGGSSVCFLVGR